MTPFVADPDFTLYQGDALTVLRELEAESVDCCVTSPPYYALRDYGTGRWEGGDEACDHTFQAGGTRSSTLHVQSGEDPDALAARLERRLPAAATYRAVCRRCGARRVDEQIGLEATLSEYVARLVDVFAEVRRVLRRDGTLWLNLGDTYASKTRGSDLGWDKSRLTNPATQQKAAAAALRRTGERHRGKREGFKDKDLMGVPWRVAFALQADGWWLRQANVWEKPNALPESTRDRPTTAHEYVFLLARSSRYFYDRDAVKESAPWERWGRQTNGKYADVGKAQLIGDRRDELAAGGERNLRSVWTIPTQPNPDEHFALMPTALAELCIRAGARERGIVLDPFAGACTTALAARALGRRAVAIELNHDYCALGARRLQQLSLLAGGAA